MANPFKQKTVVQPAPEPTPPAPMPDSSSAGVVEAGRRAQQRIISGKGRSSTTLTAPGDRGGAYTATRLGSDA